jgi:predicted nucleotidyltransferase
MEHARQDTPAALVKRHRNAIMRLAQVHGARNVRIFGSVARASTHSDSDLDLLIDLEPGRSLLDRVALIQDLEELLGIPVDVVTTKGLHPSIRDEVLLQAQPL